MWSDLASCHNGRHTREWLQMKNIPSIPKEDNPTYVYQKRAIEQNWALMSRKVYDQRWKAVIAEN